MFFPPFLSAGGLKYANMASFQAITPLISPCGEAEGSPTLHFGRHQPQPHTTLLIYSDKLVYAAEWMRNRKYFLSRRKQEKRPRKKSSLKGGGRKSRDGKNMGTGLRSGTARFLMGSLPSAPWEVRSSALQTHEGHHLLQLEGQPLFPGCIVLLQCTHNLPQRGEQRHKHIMKTPQQTSICVLDSDNTILHRFCLFFLNYISITLKTIKELNRYGLKVKCQQFRSCLLFVSDTWTQLYVRFLTTACELTEGSEKTCF